MILIKFILGQFSEQPEVLTTLYKQSNQIRCPPDVRGVFPYPFSNTQYIKCIDGRLLIKSCRRGQMFSLSRKLCDLQDHLLSFDTAVPVHLSSEDYKKSINMETSTSKF